jgi:hypothetical protein
MVTVSPPVSPSVVAAILMIQKTRVTSGTLLSVCCFFGHSSIFPMSCFSTGRLDNDRETADEENAAGGKGISHCDNKAGYDCDQGKGRHGEPGIGEEHAEELFANVTDDAH